MQVEFVWDDKKNTSNQKKHGVSFEEAKTCFEDDLQEFALMLNMLRKKTGQFLSDCQIN